MVLQQNVCKIAEQHQHLAPIFKWPSNSSINVEAALKDIEGDIGALVQEYQYYENYAAGLRDILLNKQQIKNGDRMREMAEENQKQADATQAIAKDAKRDSEVMKAITVVTLIYLPATFVCTLLSMGIFEWSSEEGGALRIAKMGWIFLAIAIPLSIITCGLAFAWLWYAGKQMSTEKVVDEEAGRTPNDEPKRAILGGIFSRMKKHLSRKMD
ncbi:hypothetical protein ONZ45_g9336 [Pleurotus djamor]|nr:hypothetical protein ONZ45_g9336 [Pleurotus djamor]